jgi:hypothetical protein
MISRIAISTLRELGRRFPVVALIGPRNSGKNTLALAAFPGITHISLGDPAVRESASISPNAFSAGFPYGAILNEAHRSPQLVSYLMDQTDSDTNKGPFILITPQAIPLSGKTVGPGKQAGMLRLLPLSISELTESLNLPKEIDELLYKGMYPALHETPVAPSTWYSAYVSGFLDRDVRQHINVRDLSLFLRFFRLCAAQTGRIVNLSMLAKECGISHNTAKAWLSVLESNHLIFFLFPSGRSYNKRLVKTPKLYFYDTGLVSWLLGIPEWGQIVSHPMRGALFETWAVSELMKGRFNRGLPSCFKFWRDNIGNEIDMIAEQGQTLVPIEIKAVDRLTDGHFEGMKKWLSLAGKEGGRGRLIYCGDEQLRRDEAAVIPWRNVDALSERI